MLTQMDQFETSALNRHLSTIIMIPLTISCSLVWQIYLGGIMIWRKLNPLSCVTRRMHCARGNSSSFIAFVIHAWMVVLEETDQKQRDRHGNGIKWSWIINRVWPVVWDQFERVAQCLNFLIECDSEFPRISFNRQFTCVALISSSRFTAEAASSTKLLDCKDNLFAHVLGRNV